MGTVMNQVCRECGEQYEVNPRLNDGYCDDCRSELNAQDYVGFEFSY